MSYEIPQQLEYKEKIIFGLTFKQLAYLFLFAPLILIIFFRTNLHIVIKIFLSINLLGLAAGFIFLNLDQHLKVWYAWFKLRNLDTQKKKDNFLLVKEIKNDLIYTKDKKLAILKIEPINFSIKPNNSKEAITLIFQKFLNSLDFPIQILMNTETLNLEDYFKEMDKKISQNKEFSTLFKKYKEHLQSISSQNNVLNRNFYLIIPEKNDIGIQTKICQNKLDALGLKSSQVKTQELKKLISQFFEGKIENYNNNSKFLQINNTLNRIIYAHGYPRSVESGFLDRIVSSLGDFDLSLHIEPFDIETIMLILNKELQKQRADLYSAKIKGILNPSLEIKYEDTESVLKNLQKGKEKLFNVGLYINCRAKTKEELDLLTKRIEAELNALLIIPREPSFRMAQGFQSCAPLAHNSLKISRNITTEALSAFFPFTS